MASREDQEKRIKKAIAKIAAGPRSVLFEEIDWVMNHLRDDLGYRMERSGSNLHYTYVVGNLRPFRVCDHHKGQKEVKVCYVTEFLDRMFELGLCED